MGMELLVPCMGHLGPKWYIDCNSQTINMSFTTKSLLNAELRVYYKYVQVKLVFLKFGHSTYFLIWSIWTQNEKSAVTLSNLIPFPKSMACWSRIMKILN